MNRDHQQEMLRRYIERLSALRAERGRQIGLEDMKEVARELGMSDDDIAAADTAAGAHRERGVHHLRHRRWNDAVTELREAAALDPLGVETLHALATAHKECWLAAGGESDRRQASELASRTIAIDPGHDPSYALLNELDQPRRRGSFAASTSPGRQGGRRRLFVGLGLVVVLAAALRIFAALHYPSVAHADGDEPVMAVADVGETELPVLWEGSRADGVNLRFSALGDGSARIRVANIGALPVRALAIRVGEGVMIDAVKGGDPPLEVGQSRVVAVGAWSGGGTVSVESVAAE